MLSSPSELEARHRLFAGKPFVEGPLAERHFQDIVREVNGLMRAADRIDLPNQYEAGAIDKLWVIYAALKKRRNETTVPPEVIAANNARWTKEQERNDFVFARAHLEDRKKRVKNWALFVEFIGLEEGDLEPSGDAWGPLEKSRSYRVTKALNWLERAQPEDFARMPAIVQQRRAEAKQGEIAQRLAALEAALSVKQSREIVEDSDVLIDFRRVGNSNV